MKPAHPSELVVLVVLVASRERDIIVRGLQSFSGFSCIRFRPYQSGDREWLSIESRDG